MIRTATLLMLTTVSAGLGTIGVAACWGSWNIGWGERREGQSTVSFGWNDNHLVLLIWMRFETIPIEGEANSVRLLSMKWSRQCGWANDGLYYMATYFIVPSWILIMLGGCLAIYPLAALWNGPLRRKRRLRRGLCALCGYDLRATTSKVCPECGKAIR